MADTGTQTPATTTTTATMDYGLDVNGSKGFGGLQAGNLGTQLTNTTTALNSSLANLDASDPGQLIKMQQEIAIYTTGLGIIASINKALEDCLKGITQKLG